jgi:hypothetical protein
MGKPLDKKPYGGNFRYIAYVVAGLIGVGSSLFLIYLAIVIVLTAVVVYFALIVLIAAIVFSAFHSASRKKRFFINVARIYLWTTFIVQAIAHAFPLISHDIADYDWSAFVNEKREILLLETSPCA